MDVTIYFNENIQSQTLINITIEYGYTLSFFINKNVIIINNEPANESPENEPIILKYSYYNVRYLIDIFLNRVHTVIMCIQFKF